MYLIKGGHLNSNKVEDIFLSKSDFKIFVSKKI
jgi:hydroxymethylpyrimidine/phosphomethylpyrimidine kinase